MTILAKAHTDVDINTMKVTFFDDTRYPSCSVYVNNLIFIHILPKVRMHVQDAAVRCVVFLKCPQLIA